MNTITGYDLNTHFYKLLTGKLYVQDKIDMQLDENKYQSILFI